jgi:RNA polymerase sigma-70 factor (ECF subfamily)
MVPPHGNGGRKGRSRWQETRVLLGDGTRSSLVGEELKRVNPAEIGTFYEREMPRLVVFVTTRTGLDIHAAADVVQTAFEKALTRWPTLRNPRAWLYRVAQNEALARCEALRREGPIHLAPDRPDPLSAALDAELREEQREVMAHLRELPPKQQEVMAWTLAGFGDAEIAEVLGLSTNAVKQSRYYARRNLAKRLGLAGRDSR